MTIGPEGAHKEGPVGFPTIFLPDITVPLQASLGAMVKIRPDVKFVVVEFYAPWCPHCQQVAPDLERVGLAFNGEGPEPKRQILFARVDCVHQRLICSHFRVTGFPKLFFGTLAQFNKATTQRNVIGSGVVDLETLGLKKGHRDAASVTLVLNDVLKLRLGGAALHYKLPPAPALAQRLAAAILDKYGAHPPSTSTLGSANDKVWDARSAVVPDVELALAITAQNIFWELAAHLHQADAIEHRAAAAEAVLVLQNTMGAACQRSLTELYVRVTTKRVLSHSHASGWLRTWQPCGQDITSYQRDWQSCAGTFPFTRGYPCGLWLLLHTATVGIQEDADAQAVVVTMRDALVGKFFKCDDCRDHFLDITKDAQSVRTRKDAVLWLWRKHNVVNARIMKEEADKGLNPYKYDAAHPKSSMWPPKSICPACMGSNGAFDTDQVHAFLVKYFGTPTSMESGGSFVHAAPHAHVHDEE